MPRLRRLYAVPKHVTQRTVCQLRKRQVTRSVGEELGGDDTETGHGHAPPRTEEEELALEELVWEMTAPHTLEDIAEWLNVSRRTVKRIEDRAMAKLRGLVSTDWESGLSEPTVLQKKLYECGATDGRTRSHIKDSNDK